MEIQMSSYSHPLVASKFMKPFSRPFHISGNSFFQLGCTSNKRWQYFSIHIPVEYIDADKPLVSNPIIMLLTDFTERLENFSEFTKSLSQMGNFVVEFDITKATSGFIMESGIISDKVKEIINDRFGNELIKITDNLIDIINEPANKQDESISKLATEFDEFLLDIGLEIISLSEEEDPKTALELASKKVVASESMDLGKTTNTVLVKEERNNIYTMKLIHPTFLALHTMHEDYMAKYNQVCHFFEELLIDVKKYYDQKEAKDLDLEIAVKFNANYNSIRIESIEVSNKNVDSQETNAFRITALSNLFNDYLLANLSKSYSYVEFVSEFNKNAITLTKGLKSEVARDAFRKMSVKVSFVNGVTQLTFTENDNKENSAVVTFAPNILPNDRLVKLCNTVEEKISYGLIEHLGISKTTASAVTRFIESSSNNIDANYAKTLLQLMAFH
jgi:hypothetical protein